MGIVGMVGGGGLLLLGGGKQQQRGCCFCFYNRVETKIEL